MKIKKVGENKYRKNSWFDTEEIWITVITLVFAVLVLVIDKL